MSVGTPPQLSFPKLPPSSPTTTTTTTSSSSSGSSSTKTKKMKDSSSPSAPLSPIPSAPKLMAFLHKLKKVHPSESLGVLGLFFLITAISFLICCAFSYYYFTYRTPPIYPTSTWLPHRHRHRHRHHLRQQYMNHRKGILDFQLDDDLLANCDLFRGMWVWDDSYPLYDPRDCPFLDQGFRCSENGKPDASYTKWRWQPHDCNIPRLDAKEMLQKLRNKRVVFVGDSIGRNQWESFLCLLSAAVHNKSSIYEVNGRPITKHNGFLVFMFRDYNCTVEYYRAPFLVLQSRPPAGAPAKASTTLKLDTMDWTSAYWRDADVLVFNTGHWWNYEKTIRSGCYFQEGGNVKLEMNVQQAYRRSIETLVDWIQREVNMSKTQVIYRTYAPVHFRGGDWKSGGNCHLEKVPDLEYSEASSRTWAPLLDSVGDVFSNQSGEGVNVMGIIEVLNITRMTDQRKDGHSSLYYLGPGKKAALHRQDCSHWCLPGVPDVWNELLYALFLRRNSSSR